MQKSYRGLLYTISVSAMCVALSIVLRFFEVMLPLGGVNACRISLEGVFLAIPAFLFGPLYGIIAGGIMDIIGCIIKPQGAYIPLLTITAALLGFFRAAFFQVGSKIGIKVLRTIIALMFSALLLLGVFAFIYTPFGDKNTVISTTTTAVGTLGLVGFGVSFFMPRERTRIFLQIFLAMFVSGMIISVVNTLILYSVYAYGVKTGLLIFLVVRLVENTAECLVVSVLLSVIFPLFIKIANKYSK